MLQATLSLTSGYQTPPGTVDPGSTHSRFEQLILAESVSLPRYAPEPHPRPLIAIALACPDLLVLKAQNAELLNAFLQEYVSELHSQHERLLVLAPTQSFANEVTRRILPLGSVVRTVPPAEELPDDLRNCSSHAFGYARVEAIKSSLTSAIHETSESVRRWKSMIPTFGQLQKLAADHALDQKSLESIKLDRIAIRSHVLQEAETAGSAIATEIASGRVDDVLCMQIEESTRQLAESRQALKQLQQLQEDKKSGRLGFFRNLLVGDVESQLKVLEEQVASIQAKLDWAVAEKKNRENEFREQKIVAEIARRDEDLQQGIEKIAIRLGELERQFRELASMIESTGLLAPNQLTSEAVTDALCAAESTIQLAEEKHVSACESLQAIEADTDQAVAQMLGRMRVVVSTSDSLSDPAIMAAPFDRVLALDAHSIPDSYLLDSVRYADRWVFCTDSPSSQPGLLDRTWSMLHQPSWLRENHRLICRLEHGSISDLVREPLADQPEIGVQFGTRADGTPVIVSVDFPEEFPLAQAVAFVAKELDEIRPVALGAGHWHDLPGAPTICWADLDTATGQWVDVAAGVRQCIAEVHGLPRTLAFRFDTAAGWTAENARAWVESRLETPRCLDLDQLSSTSR